jgi:hypothetical protein
MEIEDHKMIVENGVVNMGSVNILELFTEYF